MELKGENVKKEGIYSKKMRMQGLSEVLLSGSMT